MEHLLDIKGKRQRLKPYCEPHTIINSRNIKKVTPKKREINIDEYMLSRCKKTF